jgi:hypothetical protein
MLVFGKKMLSNKNAYDVAAVAFAEDEMQNSQADVNPTYCLRQYFVTLL